MGDFFRGWKRKVGCVVIILAFVLAGGWIRSLLFVDNLILALRSVSWEVHSIEGILEIRRHRIFGTPVFFDNVNQTRWDSFSIADAKEYAESETDVGSHSGYITRSWIYQNKADFVAFTLASGNEVFYPIDPDDNRIESNLVAFPYGIVVIPLTLVSMWLFLSKRVVRSTPCQNKPPK